MMEILLLFFLHVINSIRDQISNLFNRLNITIDKKNIDISI